MADDLRRAIVDSAGRLRLDPVDLATIISYETAGTFNPWKAGPRTQWGQHRGLIQWGEPQRAKYGVYQGMPNADQLRAVERYLLDAGFKPGQMGMLDAYSAVNAGSVGRYGASDANNGGAPGTVRDKVERQMGGHRAKAQQFINGQFTPSASIADMYGGPAPAAGVAESLPPGAGPIAEPPTFGGLALMFAQQQMAERQRAEEAERAAEEERRLALLTPQPRRSNLSRLFG